MRESSKDVLEAAGRIELAILKVVPALRRNRCAKNKALGRGELRKREEAQTRYRRSFL